MTLQLLEDRQSRLDQVFAADTESRRARAKAVRALIDEAAKRATMATGTIAEEEEGEEPITEVVGRVKRINLKIGIDTFTHDRVYSDYVNAKRIGAHKEQYHDYKLAYQN